MDQKKDSGFFQQSNAKEFIICAAIGSIICEVGSAGFIRTSQYGIPVVQVAMPAFGMFALEIHLFSRVSSSLWSPFSGMENYIISSAVVIAAYGMLLLINMSYTNICSVPIAILLFIAALWNEFWFKSASNRDVYNEAKVDGNNNKKVDDVLLIITALPFSVLPFDALMKRKVQVQHCGGSLSLSHFLWFLSSALGAVAIMVSWLHVPKASRGRQEQVVQLLHRICIVALTIVAHTMAAEWVREHIVLVCMPEILTALVWFTTPFQLSVQNLSKNAGTIRKTAVAAMFVVLAAYIASPTYEYQGTTRALQDCSFSGCLTLFSIFMLRQWPGNEQVSEIPVRMLESFVKLCFIAGAILLLVPVLTTYIWMIS